MRISDWSSDVCSSDLQGCGKPRHEVRRESRVGSVAAQAQVSEEDRLRAGWYALLAQLLSREPGDRLLEMLRGLEGDDSELGKGIQALAAAARGTTVESAREEHFNLFTGLGHVDRSEKRRGGKEWVRTCRFRWSPYH